MALDCFLPCGIALYPCRDGKKSGVSATDCNVRSLCTHTIALSLLLEGRTVHRDMHDHLLGL